MLSKRLNPGFDGDANSFQQVPYHSRRDVAISLMVSKSEVMTTNSVHDKLTSFSLAHFAR